MKLRDFFFIFFFIDKQTNKKIVTIVIVIIRLDINDVIFCKEIIYNVILLNF